MYGVTADLGFPNTPRMAIKAAHYLTPVTPDCGLTMFLPGSHRIALMLQYGYRWLHPVDDPATELQTDPALTDVERQLLGLPDHRPDGSLAKGSGAAPIRSWWRSGRTVAHCR